MPKIKKVGIFYDGNYFRHISNYYLYQHPKKSRINIGGLHHFICQELARLEDSNERYYQVVDANYFRSRLDAYESENRDLLFKERIFDNILVKAGITAHYQSHNHSTSSGIEVLLALEAYQSTLHQEYDTIVLIVDNDIYAHLINKINALGTKVMVLVWNFKYEDEHGHEKITKTSPTLLNNACYPLIMSDIINGKTYHEEEEYENLFVVKKEFHTNEEDNEEGNDREFSHGEIVTGKIWSVKDGFGFIKVDGYNDNIFFHYTELENCDFFKLREGDVVEFTYSENERGSCACEIKLLAENYNID